MDNDKIPYIAFEAEMARHERTIKRLLVALAVTIAIVFISICFEPLAEEFDMSVRQIQNIVYKSQEKLFKHLSKH